MAVAAYNQVGFLYYFLFAMEAGSAVNRISRELFLLAFILVL